MADDSAVPSVLLRIAEEKQKEIDELKKSDRDELYRTASFRSDISFYNAITKQNPTPNLIAEFKKASPSAGIIRVGVRPERIAGLYERCGASAISVLTDKHFKGKLDFLSRIRKNVKLPLLRKDFILDDSQIYESRYFGANAILLIAALLEPSQIKDFIDVADYLKMDCLVEAHNENELERAVEGGAKIIGINNRNLHTFKTDRQTTINLLEYVPKGLPVVTESAIENYDHVQELTNPRINAMLIGEAIMREQDMKGKIYELLDKTE